MCECIGGKGSTVFAHEDDVGSVIAEFAAELRLDIDIEVEHRRGDCGGDDHGE